LCDLKDIWPVKRPANSSQSLLLWTGLHVVTIKAKGIWHNIQFQHNTAEGGRHISIYNSWFVDIDH